MTRLLLTLVAAVALCASLNSPAEAAVKMTKTYVGPAGRTIKDGACRSPSHERENHHHPPERQLGHHP